MEPLYVIWSIEHDAWWLPNEWGYTRHMKNAGMFPQGRAKQIISNANAHRGQGNDHECMIPVECVDLEGQ